MGEGGVKNPETMPTSFMDGPLSFLKGFSKFLNFKHGYNFSSTHTVESNRVVPDLLDTRVRYVAGRL